jgi:hypothetical protein
MELDVNPEIGLTLVEVDARLKEHGYNEVNHVTTTTQIIGQYSFTKFILTGCFELHRNSLINAVKITRD